MKRSSICYLDNAATSFPKPRAVCDEVQRCLVSYCGNPGRSAHSLSLAAANKIYDCRVAASELLSLDAPENIFFVPNSTYGLNMMIKGVLRQGDHVLISDMEHNAVYRPIYKLSREGKISYDVFPALSLGDDFSTQAVCRNIESLIKRNTRLLICNHQSNICSLSLPLLEIGRLCKRYGILFAVDAAQSAGHVSINMKHLSIDMLCAPGHKGLYGLQGSGFVAIRNGLLLETLVEGGNGIRSLEGAMPEISPERYESGTLATPCIAGLCEGIREVKQMGIDNIGRAEAELYSYLLERLEELKDVTIYAKRHKGSTLLLNLGDYPSDAVAAALDKSGICVRGGFHCSALAHTALGTADRGGVRISFGIFNTKADVDRLALALSDIQKSSI